MFTYRTVLPVQRSMSQSPGRFHYAISYLFHIFENRYTTMILLMCLAAFRISYTLKRWGRTMCLAIIFSVSLPLSVSVSLCVCLSLALSLCLSLPLSVSLPLCVCVSLSLCLSPSLSLPLSVCLSLSGWLSHFTYNTNVLKSCLIYFNICVIRSEFLLYQVSPVKS